MARRSRVDLTTPGLLGLPLAWLVVFFLIPIGIVGAFSVDALYLTIYPGAHEITFDAWRDFLNGSEDLRLFWKSVKMSLLVSVIVVALAYPLAYYLALSGTKRKYVLLLLLIAPFLTSYLLRVLAWKVILGSQGVVNSFLFWTGRARPGRPRLAASLQPVRRRARARLRVGSVRRAADLRLARGARPPAARGCERPGSEPLAGVLARDAAAQHPRRRRGIPLRVHPDGRRVRHAVTRRRHLRLHVRERDRRPLRDEPRLADGLGARPLPARRRGRAR